MMPKNRTVDSTYSRLVRPSFANLLGCLLRASCLMWAAAGAGFFVATPLQAQIAVDRGEIELRAGSAEQRIALITLRNDGNAPVQASILLEDWDRDERGTNRWHKLGTVQGSCGERITIFPRAVQLAPGQSQAVRVVVDSSLALDRECWAAAIVQVAQPTTANGRSATLNIRTAVKLYVNDSRMPLRGELEDVLIERDTMTILYRNTGLRHHVASGRVEVRDLSDRLITTVALPDLYVLPDAMRRAAVALPKLAAGKYVLLAIADFGGRELTAAQVELDVVGR